MATLNKGLITQAGLDLFNKVEAGNAQITYTKVVFSSNTDILNMQDTDVRHLNDVQPQEIKGIPQAYDNGTVTGENNIKAAEVDIRCVVDNEKLTKGFKPYTTALYASDGNKEILYGLYLRDDPGYLPPFDGLTRQPLMFTWRLFTATTDNFNLDDKSDVYATLADLQGVDNKVDAIQEATDKLSAQIDDKIKDLSNSLQNQINNAIAQEKASTSDFLNKYSGNIDKLNLVVAKLKGNPPTKPTLNASMDTQKGQISYKITPPSDNGGSNVYQYQIFYKSVSDTNYQETDQPGNMLNGTIYNLSGKMKYNLYVVAQNAAGASPQSDIVTTDIIDSNIYGVSWNRTSDPNLTRTDAAVGLSTTDNGHNDFDDVSVWKQMHQVSDNQGHTFIRIPKCYIKKTQTGSENSGEATWQISLAPFDGAYLPKCFIDYDNNKAVMPYIDVSTSIDDLGSDTIDNLRNKARNYGKGYQLIDVHIVDLLQVLFIIENATLIAQNVSNWQNYRGMSDFIVYGWVDGVNFNNSDIWVCDNPSQYQSNVYANPYYQIGYSKNTTNYSDNVSSMNFDPNNPDIQFPNGLNGDSSQYYGDDYYGESGQYIAYLYDVWSWYLNNFTSLKQRSRLIKRPVA